MVLACYIVAEAEIYSADWLVTDAYEQASNCCLSGVAVPSDADAASGAAASQAIGGASLERFQWACSVRCSACDPVSWLIRFAGVRRRKDMPPKDPPARAEVP
eukprot:1148407-Pelagomonas_calceolata.AAC.3